MRQVVPRPAATRSRHPGIDHGIPGHRTDVGRLRRGGEGRRERPDRHRRSHHNPWSQSLALLAYGTAFSATDPVRARDALRRGLVIAQDSGNGNIESLLANGVSRLEAAKYGDPLAALDYSMLVIRNFNNAGNTILILSPLSHLAALFDRLGRYEPAATIAGFAVHPFTTFREMKTAIAHLRDLLGDQKYESLARKGGTMTTAEIVAYVFDQINQARTELEQPSESLDQ
jgi:hypothetical protein